VKISVFCVHLCGNTEYKYLELPFICGGGMVFGIEIQGLVLAK
jgi:hypothetical protein